MRNEASSNRPPRSAETTSTSIRNEVQEQDGEPDDSRVTGGEETPSKNGDEEDASPKEPEVRIFEK
jgi:hypothetical protein